MGWCTEYASRNSSICGQNFLLEIAVFKTEGVYSQDLYKLTSHTRGWIIGIYLCIYIYLSCPVVLLDKDTESFDQLQNT